MNILRYLTFTSEAHTGDGLSINTKINGYLLARLVHRPEVLERMVDALNDSITHIRRSDLRLLQVKSLERLDQQVTHAYSECEAPSQRLTNVMESSAQRFRGREFVAHDGCNCGPSRDRIHDKRGSVAWTLHSYERVCQPSERCSNFGAKLHKNKNAFVLHEISTSFRFLSCNLCGQVSGTICAAPQADRNPTKPECHHTQPQCHDTQKDGRPNREGGNEDCPSVPPNHATTDARLHARADSMPQLLPTVHSLIPLWIGRHSAMPMQPEEIAHG